MRAPPETAHSSKTSATGPDCPQWNGLSGSLLARKFRRELSGSDTSRLYHDHVLVKEPGTKQRTPWHQDQPYYNVSGTQNASMWFPVDPVDRSATLEFIAGSHRGPWYMPRTFLDEEAKWFPDGSLAELPDFATDNAHEPGSWTVLGWELEPGDAVFFNMLTGAWFGWRVRYQSATRPVGSLPRR